MKIKTLKAICTKRYGQYTESNGLIYLDLKISEYNRKIIELKQLRKIITKECDN